MQKAKITVKGQVTIPKVIRDALTLKEGDSVIFMAEGDHAVLKPLKKKSLLDFYGTVPATRPYKNFETVRKEVHNKIAKRFDKKGTE